MSDDYMVFMGNRFYPSGGWEDYQCSFDNIEKCKNYIKMSECDCKWAHIVYMGKIIMRGEDIQIDYYNNIWKFEEVENEMG